MPLRIEIGFDLSPGQRHGDSCSGPRMRRQRRDRRGHAVIAQIVEEDASVALVLSHLGQVELRVVARHSHAHVMRKTLRLGPGELATLRGSEWCHHMQALSAGCLAEADKPEIVEAITHLLCSLHHGGERHVRTWVQVEDQAARQFRQVGLAVPGMQLHRTDLRHRREPFDAINLQIGLLVPEYGHQFQQVRRARHGMALEELLATESIRGPNDRARPSADVLDQPGADGLIVAGKVFLGDRRAIVGVRPERLVGI